jgi:hypothetical protein
MYSHDVARQYLGSHHDWFCDNGCNVCEFSSPICVVFIYMLFSSLFLALLCSCNVALALGPSMKNHIHIMNVFIFTGYGCPSHR